MVKVKHVQSGKHCLAKYLSKFVWSSHFPDALYIQCSNIDSFKFASLLFPMTSEKDTDVNRWIKCGLAVRCAQNYGKTRQYILPPTRTYIFFTVALNDYNVHIYIYTTDFNSVYMFGFFLLSKCKNN